MATDSLTQRPRTPNDQYTVLTEQQIRNIKKDPSPFFHTTKRETALKDNKPREGGRYYLDRYCNVTSEHNVRGNLSQPFGWIADRHERTPPEAYNSCRGRAAVRWGPNKAGERTRSHFAGESIDRYTMIDMYRRPPTNYPGRVVMDCGRPGDGYYAQRYPSRTTWFGSSVPLNRTEIMTSLAPKTVDEYKQIHEAEQSMRAARQNQWPEFSEYTDKYLLQTRVEPQLSSLEEKKRNITMAKIAA